MGLIKKILLSSFFVLTLLFSHTVFAAWNGNPYTVGSTLDPECGPTDTNCTVDLGALKWTAGTSSSLYYNDGNIGVGTSTPDSPLVVQKEGNGSGITLARFITNDTWQSAFSLENTSTNGGNYQLLVSGENNSLIGPGAFAIYNTNTQAVPLNINGNGNVGIGVTSPEEKLHVNGNVSADNYYVGGAYDDTTNDSPWYGIGMSGHSLPDSEGEGQTVQLAGYYGLQMLTANGNIVLNEQGDLGIGTESPKSKLDVSGSAILSGSGNYFNFGDTAGSEGYGVRDNSGTLQFKNADGEWADMGSGSGTSTSVWNSESYGISYAGANVGVNASSTSRASLTVGATPSAITFSHTANYETYTPVRNVTVSDHYLFSAENTYMGIYDITAPTNENVLSTYEFADGVKKVLVSNDGNTAYVLLATNIVYSVDVTDKTSPIVLGSFQTNSDYIADIALVGNVVYAFDYVQYPYFYIIDFSDPESPVLSNDEYDLTVNPSNNSRIVVSGDYAYISGYGGVEIINISDSAHPTFAGLYDLSESNDPWVNSVLVSGNYLYLEKDAQSGDFEAVDISDKAHPTFVSNLDIDDWRWDTNMVKIGDIIYFADGDTDSIYAINVANPAVMYVAGYTPSPYDSSKAMGVAFYGDSMFVADWHSGIDVYSYAAEGNSAVFQGKVGIGLSDPTTLLHISGGVNDILTIQSTLGTQGNTANINFQTYETINHTLRPTSQISAIDDGSYSSALAFNTKNPGAEANGLIERMRVSSDGKVGINTTSPQAQFDVNGSVFLSGENRYLNFGNAVDSGGYGFRDNEGVMEFKNSSGEWAGVGSTSLWHTDDTGIHVISGNVGIGATSTTSTALSVTGTGLTMDFTQIAGYESTTPTYDLVLSGTTMYVADGNYLRLFDVSIPATETLLSSYDFSSQTFVVRVSGTTAYVSAGGYIYILDVTDPTQTPVLLGQYQASSTIMDIQVIGTTLYAVDNGTGYYMINISDPTNPTLSYQGSTNAYAGWASRIAIYGNYEYISENNELEILDISDPSSPQHVTDFAIAGYSGGMAISGHYLYLATGTNDSENSFLSFDISTPTLPVLVGNADIGAWRYLTSVTIDGGYAYVADGVEDSIYGIDISHPANLAVLGHVATGGSGRTYKVAISGDTVFAAQGNNSIEIFTRTISGNVATFMNGNVGIGTLTPGATLEIAGLGAGGFAGGWPSLVNIHTENSDPYGLTFQNDEAGTDAEMGVFLNNDGNLVFGSGPSHESLQLTQAGNVILAYSGKQVAIGTTNFTNANLTVQQTQKDELISNNYFYDGQDHWSFGSGWYVDEGGAYFISTDSGPISSVEVDGDNLGGGYHVGDDLTVLANNSRETSDAVIHVGTVYGQVTQYTVTSAGSGYIPGDVLFINAGPADEQITVDAVDGGGGIVTSHISSDGSGGIGGIGVTSYDLQCLSCLGAGAGANIATVNGSGEIQMLLISNSGTKYETGFHWLSGGSGEDAGIIVDEINGISNRLRQSDADPATMVDGTYYDVSLYVGGNTGDGSVNVCLDDGSCQSFNAGSGNVSFSGQYWNDSDSIVTIIPYDGFTGPISMVSIRPTKDALQLLSSVSSDTISVGIDDGISNEGRFGLLIKTTDIYGGTHSASLVPSYDSTANYQYLLPALSSHADTVCMQNLANCGESLWATVEGGIEYNDGNVSIGNGALSYDNSTYITNIENASLGGFTFPDDAGVVSWIDMPVTDAQSQGTVESYTASIGDSAVLTVYGEADGNGGVQNLRVGINNATPDQTFAVDGTVSFANLSAAEDATVYLCLDSSNQVVTSAGACESPSSERFKKDINDLKVESGMAEVMKLNPVSFFYTPEFNGAFSTDINYNSEQVGFIAEQMAKIDPRLVTYEKDGKTIHGVRYEKITSILTKALQELNNTVLSFKDKFITKEIDTQKLCVGDACVTQTEFLRMIQSSGSQSTTPSPISTSTTESLATTTDILDGSHQDTNATSTTLGSDVTASSTDLLPQDSSTTTVSEPEVL